MFGKTIADLVIKPGKAPLFDNPSNYDLKHEEIEFKAKDGVIIRGWLVNPGKAKVIIQSHFGVQCSRAGYTPEGKGWLKGYPEDIKFLIHAKHLADAGYSVLMYDLRNHGESDSGINKWICDGQEEYKDVLAAVKYISSHLQYKDAAIGLLSLCMGSSSTLYAYGIEDGLENISNIKAMVMVQPSCDGAFFKSTKMPKFLINSANKSSIKRGGPDMNETPLDRVKSVNIPTLVMQNENDPMHDPAYVNQVFKDLKVEKEYFTFKGEKNRLYGYSYFGHHPEKMLEWFGKYL